MRSGGRSALLSAPIVAAIAAIAVIELGVLALALFGSETDPCARPAILRSARADATCAAQPRDVKYDQQLYQAVVDTVYHPQRYASVQRGRGVLLLARAPVSGVSYLNDSSLLAALRTSLPAGAADDLITEFRKANAAHAEYSPLYLLDPIFLDSASVHAMMFAPAAELAKDPLVHDLLAGFSTDSLPPVLTLSRPGVDAKSDVAMVYAAMYDRQARTPDHLEAAAFLLARRDGARWLVTREVPIPLARRP